MRSRKASLLLIIGIVLLIGVCSVSADVLRWDASTGDVDGYQVYWGNVPSVYPFTEDVGNVLEVGTPDQDGALADHFKLNPGTWYFIVRAYNTSGESGDSNVADMTIAENIQPENNFPIKIVVPATTTITITNN